MKLFVALCYLTIVSLLDPALGQLIALPSLLQDRLPRVADHQKPIMNGPNIVLPPSNKDSTSSDHESSEVVISDVIGKERSIGIYAGFTRDIDSISKRLDDGSQNATVLAPLNSEITRLPRKPWEDPREYAALGDGAYHGSDGEGRANKNLRRFVEAHIVPESPWEEGKKVKTLAGNTVWLEMKDGRKTVSGVSGTET